MQTDNHLLAKIGQYALIRNGEARVLMLERIGSKTWAFPGGRLDKGESWDAAFVREVLEETGFAVVSMRPFATNTISDPYPKYRVYFDTVVRSTDDSRLSPEHSDFRWISADDFPELIFEDELVARVVSDFLREGR